MNDGHRLHARSARPARGLLAASSLLLGLGLVAPCMSIIPRIGSLTPFAAVLNPALDSVQQVSIYDGVISLFREGQVGIALVIFFFSIFFPLAKLTLLWIAADQLTHSTATHAMLGRLEKLGKLSMLDIFVLAIIVVSFKHLPGDSILSIEWGAYVFMVSILLSLPVPRMIKQLLAPKAD